MKLATCIVLVAVVVASARADTGSTVCPDACTDQYDPVCGSDGVTYSNACDLSLAACNSKSGTTQVSDGECPAACDYACPAISDPVCGSDGVTYSNACDLSLAACNSKSGTTQVSDGECPAACDYACPAISDPVCGSDGVTYSNA
ncbi:hypothetical protein BBJ28_00025620 [Nothophytophthora sp. Chile5]|nr:hypothetical protein BBJ28_00025620 [Nothophytophthora sp. Chile5]